MAGVREALHSCGSLRAGPWTGLPPHPPQEPLQGVQGGSLGYLSIRLEDRCKVGQGSFVQPPQGPLQGVQGGSLGHLPIHLENRCKVSKVGHWVTCPSVSRTAAFNPGWVTGSLVLSCQGPLLSIQGGSLGHLSICVKDRCFQSRVGHWVTCPSVSRTTVRWPR